jgi:anion-transporting  ArsA/GET3 family ATPase
VTGALALAAANAGLSALIVEIEGKSGLPGLFGHDTLSYDELVLLPEVAGEHGAVRARTLTPDEALIEYLSQSGLHRVSKRLAESGALDMVATATPGIKDVLILGKIKQLERAGVADVIIVDAPAAGHAISFLRSARGLLDAVKVGPIETQAREVMELLSDARRCQVMLVSLPEETPVNEVIETAYSLEDHVGIKLSPVVVNGVYPPLELSASVARVSRGAGIDEAVLASLEDARQFRLQRGDLQAIQLERLAVELPLEQISLPYLFTADLDLSGLQTLATQMLAGIAALPEPR